MHDNALEEMCRAYWNAYRDGFLSVGGSKDYPTWDEFSETRAKEETRRCMRHAVEVLLTMDNKAMEAAGIDNDESGAPFVSTPSFIRNQIALLFPDAPMRRKPFERLQAEVQAEALNAGMNRGA